MKILIVDDDKGLADMLRNNFKTKSHSVDVAYDGGDGSFMGKSYDYDTILLDHSLPKKDGLTICKEIRSAGKTTPIIFMSVVDSVENKISALDHGADDYLVKPFLFEELQARIRAVGRRPDMASKPVLKVGDVSLDQKTNLATRGGKVIPLTHKEFGLLEYLMRNAGQVVTRTMLLEHVWEFHFDPHTSVVETHISRLRAKVDKEFDEELIHTVRGSGYSLSVSA